MKIKLFALMFAAFLIFGITALAHHSFAGSYIEDKTVTIEGKVVQFDIRNPHSFINIEVIGKDGKVANALRTLLRMMAAREGQRVQLEIV